MAQCPLLPWYIILDFRFKPERSIVSVRQWIYIQGSTGIRQWLINWCTSLMIIHNSISFVDYNEWLKRLEPINQNSIKVPKLLRQPIRYLYYKTLGTSVKNSPMSPPSLGKIWDKMHLPCSMLVVVSGRKSGGGVCQGQINVIGPTFLYIW